MQLMRRVCQAYRAKKRITAGVGVATESASPAPASAAPDDEEMEYEPDKLNMQLEVLTPLRWIVLARSSLVHDYTEHSVRGCHIARY